MIQEEKTVKSYYENGNRKELSRYLNGELHGIRSYFYPNGEKRAEVNYVNDKKEEACVEYYVEGSIAVISNYVNDEQHGEAIHYNTEGIIEKVANYDNGIRHGETIYYITEGEKRGKVDYKVFYINGVRQKEEMKIISLENKGTVSQETLVKELKEKAKKGGYYVSISRYVNQRIKSIKLRDIFTDLQENTQWKFDVDGVLESMCIFKGGELHGEYIRYAVSCDEMFINSVSMWKEGERVSFDNTTSCHVRTPRAYKETDETRFLRTV